MKQITIKEHLIGLKRFSLLMIVLETVIIRIFVHILNSSLVGKECADLRNILSILIICLINFSNILRYIPKKPILKDYDTYLKE